MGILKPGEGEANMALAAIAVSGANSAAAQSYGSQAIQEAQSTASGGSTTYSSGGTSDAGGEDIANPGFGGQTVPEGTSDSGVVQVIKDNAGTVAAVALTAISFLPWGRVLGVLAKAAPFFKSLLTWLGKFMPTRLLTKLPFVRPKAAAITFQGALLYSCSPVYNNKVDSLNRPWFAPGAKGSAVGNVTTKLKALGVLSAASNTYTSNFSAHILAWQKKVGVPVTEHQNKAIWGSVSWAKLDTAFAAWQKTQQSTTGTKQTTTTTSTTSSTKSALVSEMKNTFTQAGGLFTRAVGWAASLVRSETANVLSAASVTALPWNYFKTISPLMGKLLAGYAKASTNDNPSYSEGAYWSQFRMPGTTAVLAKNAGLKGGLPTDVTGKAHHLMLYCLYIDDIAGQLFDTTCMPKDSEVRKAYVAAGFDKMDLRVRMTISFFLLWHCRNLKKLWRDQRYVQAAIAAAAAACFDITTDKNS